MSKGGWLSSSIGRKFIMALSGLFLITFLIVHLSINMLSVFSKELFNAAAHFMATNWVIQAMQIVLAAGFLIHIIMGLVLTGQNRAARDKKYAFNKPSANSNLPSRSMVVTGILVLLFLVIHLKHYFIELKWGDMNGFDNDYDLLVSVFSIWYFTVIYVISFVLLAVHLNHGFQSAFQSVGVNHNRYTPIIKKLSTAFCWVMGVGFSSIALFHFFQS